MNEWELHLNIMKDKAWFLSRIGKTVYWQHPTCPCDTCLKAWMKGMIVRDEKHAFDLWHNETHSSIIYSDERPDKKP